MERRNLFRVEFNTEVDLIDEDITISTKLKNLNLAGIYVLTSSHANFEPDTLLDVIIKSEKNLLKSHLNLKGKILRTDKEGMVIKFTKMGPKVFEELKRIITFKAKMIPNDFSMDSYMYSESNTIKKFRKVKVM